MNQSNALTNWEKQMERRRRQQGNLASKYNITYSLCKNVVSKNPRRKQEVTTL